MNLLTLQWKRNLPCDIDHDVLFVFPYCSCQLQILRTHVLCPIGLHLPLLWRGLTLPGLQRIDSDTAAVMLQSMKNPCFNPMNPWQEHVTRLTLRLRRLGATGNTVSCSGVTRKKISHAVLKYCTWRSWTHRRGSTGDIGWWIFFVCWAACFACLPVSIGPLYTTWSCHQSLTQRLKKVSEFLSREVLISRPLGQLSLTPTSGNEK